MASEAKVRSAFRRQEQWCHAMHAPVYARLCAAVADGLTRDTRTGARVLDWPGDPNADALPLRLLGGVNALVRAGRDDALAAVFGGEPDGVEAALAGALRRHDEAVLPWLDGPPQTNEVGRAAAIAAGLLVVAKRFGPAMELLELGSSAGLLLNLARYCYDLGGVAAGDPASPLAITPEWRGALPPSAPLEVCAARGVDLAPLDLRDAATRERLLTYVWPEQPARLARLERAVAIARLHPPRIDRADGAEWIGQWLAGPQPAGVTRVAFHSIALQYLPLAGRERVRVAIEAAGTRATEERPLAWLGFEMDPARGAVALNLRTWPRGEQSEFASCHPHASWIEWHRGPPGL